MLGGLPLWLGLGILSKNQARPWQQGPPSMGAGMAAGIENYMAYQQQAQEQQQAELEWQRQQAEDRRKQQEFSQKQAEWTKANEREAGIADAAQGGFTSEERAQWFPEEVVKAQIGQEFAKPSTEWVVGPNGKSKLMLTSETLATGVPKWERPRGGGQGGEQRLTGENSGFYMSPDGQAFPARQNADGTWGVEDPAQGPGVFVAPKDHSVQGLVPTEVLRIQQASGNLEQRKKSVNLTQQAMEAETAQDSTSAARLLTEAYTDFVVNVKSLDAAMQKTERQSVVDAAIMRTFVAAVDPGSRKASTTDIREAESVRSLAESIGVSIESIAIGKELPESVRNEMLSVIQNYRDVQMDAIERRVKNNVINAWPTNPKYVPPDVRTVKDAQGRVYWKWPDGTNEDMTEFYQQYGGQYPGS
jgi:hypothetical protein